MGQLPQITNFYDEHRAQGLHLFNMLGKETAQDKIDGFFRDYKINFTTGLADGNDIGNYPSGVWPYTYVIGADGKVKFQGDRSTDLQWFKVVEKELESVQYPFLGLRDVHKDLAKAATSYTSGNYGDAAKQAGELQESGNPDVAASANALVARVDARISSRKQKLQAAKAERRYHHAVNFLEELSGKAYEGLDICDESAEALKELKKDKEVKAELKAWDALDKLLEDNKKARSDADRKKALSKFYEKNEGMAAADEARKLAEAIR